MPGPKKPIRQRIREQAAAMRSGTKKGFVRAWGMTKTGTRKIGNATLRMGHALNPRTAWKNPRTRKIIVGVGTGIIILGSTLWYRNLRNENGTRYLNRPGREYIEYVHGKKPGTTIPILEAIVGRVPLDQDMLTRSGMKQEDAQRMNQLPVGRALLWERIMENGRSAVEDEQLTYTEGMNGILGKGKRGFILLRPDKQAGVLLYWGFTGEIKTRMSNGTRIADVNTMCADPRVFSIMRSIAIMEGRVSTEELGELLDGKTTPAELKRKHDW